MKPTAFHKSRHANRERSDLLRGRALVDVLAFGQGRMDRRFLARRHRRAPMRVPVLGDGEPSEDSDDEKPGVRRARQARQAGEVWRAHGEIDRPQAVVQFPRSVSTVRLAYYFFCE